MKKICLIFSLTLCVVSAYTLEKSNISVGLGGYFTRDIMGGLISDETEHSEYNYLYTYNAMGGFIFFDINYLEFSIGFSPGFFVWLPDGDYSYGGIDFGLMGKYPFTVSDKLSFFPFLGMTYRFIYSISQFYYRKENNKMENPMEHNAFLFRFGAGLDCSFTDRIFLRTGISYGLRLKNKNEREIQKFTRGMRYVPGHGPEVKLSLGYRF